MFKDKPFISGDDYMHYYANMCFQWVIKVLTGINNYYYLVTHHFLF